MADRTYTWHCAWCDESYSGPYRESVERERQHRADCVFRPESQQDARPAPAPAGHKGKLLMLVINGTNCTADGNCSRRHCWHDGHYRGELCAWPVSKDLAAPWQACPNLANPTTHEIYAGQQ